MCKLICQVLSRPKGTEEIPSPSDIVKSKGIKIVGSKITIDYEKDNLNIPFTETPKLVDIMDIPDTNSMDGLMDYGHNPFYIEPINEENHQILVDWLASEFMLGESSGWKQGGANDCVYRVMANPVDDQKDFSKPALYYAIHRILRLGTDTEGRYWIFKGINNPLADPVLVRDRNIIWLNTGVVW